MHEQVLEGEQPQSGWRLHYPLMTKPLAPSRSPGVDWLLVRGTGHKKTPTRFLPASVGIYAAYSPFINIFKIFPY